MERKLLSLPSFFVLLLVAGIAFLAAPVVDVQAQTVPTATVELVSMTPTGATAGAALTAGGAKNLFIIKFNTPVNVTSSTPTVKFDKADLKADLTDTSPAALTGGGEIPAARITLTPIATTAAAPLNGAPAANQWFAVSLTVPASGTGTLVLTVRGSGATPAGAFQSADAGVWAAAGGATATVYYDTYDATKPTVAITAVDGGGATTAATGGAISRIGGMGDEDIFQLKVAVTDNRALAANQALATTEVSVTTTMPAPAAGTTATPYAPVNVWKDPDASAHTDTTTAYIVVINPPDNVAEVEITVAANAFTDASTNGNDETKKKVTINSRPTVRISVMGPLVPPATTPPPVPDPIPTSFTSDITVKLELSAVPAGLGGTGTSNAPNLQESDITVTNGTLQAGSLSRDLTAPPTATAAATYTATVTLPAAADRKSPFTIVIAAGSFEAGGVGNTVSNTVSHVVTIPTTTGPSTPTVDPMGTTGTALTGADVGFTFDATIGANGFVVLAKSPHGSKPGSTPGSTVPLPNDAGFTSALTTAIDIKDAVWQDLRHFLVTTEGGTIDLIGPAGTPVKSVVISEVMWGNDNGKSDPTSSQWIELYNTTGAPITLTNWKLQFSTKSSGLDMLTGDAAKATATAGTGALTTSGSTGKPVVDKLSTWRDVGNYWLWQITDTVGGSHGQSGKSTRNSATSPGAPVELISMQRKINYTTVEKTDHVSGTTAANIAANRNKQLEGVPGTASGNWEASPEHGYLLTYRKGTPGAKPSIQRHDKTGVARSSVVFNEIANRSDKKYDWIELHNKSSADKKINGWELSVVTATGTDTELFTFTAGTNGNDIVVPAKGFLLIVNTDPRNTPLEGGYDVVNSGNSARQSDGSGNKPSRLYYVSDKLDIPKEKFLLILRNGNDKTGTHEKIEDIAGNNPDFPSDADNTDVWPLRVWDLGATDDLGEKNDKTWARDQGKAIFNGDEWKDNGGFTGVGIDRKYKSSDSYTSGTPGYANNAVQTEVKSDGLTATTPVVISEIMFATANNRLPQWIELHNPSHTQAVNLKGWKLDILNYHGDQTLEVDHSATLTLPEVRIRPNQTVLIVSTTGRSSGSDEFPDDRLINIWSNTDLRNALQMQNRRNAILSSTGFYLKLSDPRKTEVDVVGNIDGNRRTDDEPPWNLPGGDLDNGRRSSMVRVADTENDGEEGDSWRDASQVDSLHIKVDELYYGDEDDYGTPGYTPGGVLPVQLSSFYSKRNDAGAVIITWATESELDNAGFNILRSVSRSGEFTRINAQLIPGAGTTGEKNTYTWTDTSARPNVVYYYQIEDVSLDGEHRTLRTTRLRGYVGAAGKATTIWGELKSRD